MNKILAGLTACVILSIEARGQNFNACIEDSYSLCAVEPSIGFLNHDPVSVCIAQPVSLKATNVSVAGRVDTYNIHLDCSTTTSSNEVNSSMLSNWWSVSVGTFSSNGTGLLANFTPTSAGTGLIKFYSAYVNTSPCSGLVKTITNNISITVISCDSDGDGIPDEEDLNPNDPSIGRLQITIVSPINGSTVN